VHFAEQLVGSKPSRPCVSLIVGLGNPGAEYEKTRHNVGAWFVESIADQCQVKFKLESKFMGHVAKIQLDDHACYLLLPTTFMNRSGYALRAFSQFYRIPTESILVVHDDLDLSLGTVRLKEGGGDGGHNGLRSITEQLGTKDFLRLRVGIGHPGHRDRVLDYVLGALRRDEAIEIRAGLDRALILLTDIIQGNLQKVMQQLH
jgi:peptidyl-tRNA hydrolase, PTH1 family